jgi:hypothetical protein
LEDGEYIELRRSDLFPVLTPEVLQEHLWMGEAEGVVVMVNAFREWVKENSAKL